MAMTYAQVLAQLEIQLGNPAQDASATVVLENLIKSGLIKVSQYVPWETSVLKSMTASTKYVTLTAGDKWKAIELSGAEGYYNVEYEVDQTTKEYRNYSRHGDTVTIEIDNAPSAAANVRLFIAKQHILQKELGTADAAGAVSTAGTAGDTTLVLKSLGTGTINEDTKLTIADDDTEYNVYATATIATATATVSIWPPLQAAAAENAVVTLALHDYTMSPELEQLLCDWVEAQALLNVSMGLVNGISIGSNTVQLYRQLGMDKLAIVTQELNSLGTKHAKKKKLYLES